MYTVIDRYYIVYKGAIMTRVICSDSEDELEDRTFDFFSDKEADNFIENMTGE